ncbi:MAG: hypothetical protein RR051_00735, partial [Clostridiales bacterium]
KSYTQNWDTCRHTRQYRSFGCSFFPLHGCPVAKKTAHTKKDEKKHFSSQLLAKLPPEGGFVVLLLVFCCLWFTDRIFS